MAHALFFLTQTPLLQAQAPTQLDSQIGQAKSLYANADYDGALSALATIEAASPKGVTYEVHYYRALCLVALGRTEDAERAMAATVAADPAFSPSAADMSPRIQALFSDVRERLLPQIARRHLADARGVSRDGDPVRALAAIDAALTLLNDPRLAARADLEDLRLAAGTMRELTNAQVVAAAQATQAELAKATAAAPPAATAPGPTAMPPAPVSPTPAPAAAGPASTPVTTAVSNAAVPPVTAVPTAAPPAASQGVAPQPEVAPPSGPVPAIVPPVAIKQDMPRWNPNDAMARDASAGAIRVQIDATGRVTGATMERPVHPLFDVLMIEAAKTWRYRPATRNGQPIPWESVVAIKVDRPTR